MPLENILDTLSQDVQQAQDQGDFDLAAKLITEWVDNRSALLAEVAANLAAASSENLYEDLAIGYLGLMRIGQVLSTGRYKNDQLTHREYQQFHRRLGAVYQKLNIAERVPWSIHGGAMHWLGEISQDNIAYFAALGNIDRAKIIASRAIENRHHELKHLGIVSLDQESEFRRKKWIGTTSVLGVLYARQGRIGESLEDLIKGLQYVRQAHRVEANSDRVRVIADWTLSAATDSTFPAEPQQRTAAQAHAKKVLADLK